MRKLFKENIFLIAILILASIIRLYSLSSLPISLNPDELAIGYNSYSLLTTGKDEWGATFPLSLKSFGDWKLPVYPLVEMPFIATLGLNEFAVRLPSALAGIGSVFLIYLVSVMLFKKKSIGLFAAFFMSISPWSVIFSRGAFEPNLGLFFLLLGVYLFQRFTEEGKLRLFTISSLIFGLTLFTYHGYDVFSPLFFLGLIFLNRKLVIKNRKSIFPIIIFFSFFLIFIFSISSGSVGKLNDLSVLNDKNNIYNRAEIFLTDRSTEPLILKKVLYNRYVSSLYQFGQNYLTTFSPSFLFDRGGVKLFYNVKGFGFMYLFEVLLLGLGIASLYWNKEKNANLIMLLFLIAPLPLAITREVPDPTRAMALLPALILIEGYGLNFVFEYLRKTNLIYKTVGAVVVLACLFNVLMFLNLYFNHTNIHNAAFYHYGYKELAQVTSKYPNYNVVMTAPDNFPYISFLFYERYDPNKFRSEVIYYPENVSKFALVKSFGRYSIVDKIDWNNLKSKTIYIDRAGTTEVKNLIRLPNGDPLFTYIIKN